MSFKGAKSTLVIRTQDTSGSLAYLILNSEYCVLKKKTPQGEKSAAVGEKLVN